METGEAADRREQAVQKGPQPPAPEITSFLTVGFNSTNRSIEAQTQASNPTSSPNSPSAIREGGKVSLANPRDKSTSPRPLAAIFVARFDQHSAMFSHLPLLVANASLAASTGPAVRLVSLPKGAMKRLSIALHLPRVSMIGLEDDAQSAASLIAYVRDNVPPVEIPWLKDLPAGNYLPTAIKSTMTTAPAKSIPRRTSNAAAQPSR